MSTTQTRKINEINKNVARQMRDEIQTALEGVAQKFGLHFTVGNCRLDSVEATYQLNMVALGDDAEGKSPAELAEAKAEKIFAEHAMYVGLQESDFGKTFKAGRDTFQISGIKPSARKNTIIAKMLSNGKQYVFNHYDVKKYLEAK